MDLRALDDRVLPTLAGRLRRVVGRARRVGERTDRVRRDGVRLLRERPLVSAGLLAALLAATVLSAVSGDRQPGATVAAPAGPTVGYGDVGPTAGQAVADYLAAARHRLSGVAHSSRRRLALVDLTGYVTVADASRLLAGVGVARVYFRAHGPGVPTQSHSAVVQSIAGVPGAIEATAGVERAAARSFGELAAAIPARTTSERQVRDIYARQAAAAQAEARLLTPGCACLYAAVVSAPGTVLAALAAHPGVRVVDPAPAGVPLEGLGAIPLLPETTGRVPSAGPPATTAR